MNGVHFPTLRHEVDRLFEFLVHNTWGKHPAAGNWVPAADVCEGPELYRVELDLPGVRQTDVSIETQGRTLSVRGVRSPRGAGDARSCLAERPRGAFSRSFHLPQDADSRALRARMEDGVLRIEIPRIGLVDRRTG